jgi:hypothetical protein
MFAYFWLKNQEKRQKTTEKEATGQSFQHRTPNPKSDTDTDPRSVKRTIVHFLGLEDVQQVLQQEATGCPAPERTIVQSEAEPADFVQLGARRQSEQSQRSATFFQPGVTSAREARANNNSVYAREELGEKTNKKNQS